LTEDAFSGEALVNHKQYYYMAIAYAYNEFMIYSQDPGAQNPPIIGLDGQKEPYLAGRNNIKSYTAIPHPIVGKVSAESEYGDMPSLQRLAGQGNGGNVINMTQESIEKILEKPPYNWADSTNPNEYGTPEYR